MSIFLLHVIFLTNCYLIVGINHYAFHYNIRRILRKNNNNSVKHKPKSGGGNTGNSGKDVTGVMTADGNKTITPDILGRAIIQPKGRKTGQEDSKDETQEDGQDDRWRGNKARSILSGFDTEGDDDEGTGKGEERWLHAPVHASLGRAKAARGSTETLSDAETMELYDLNYARVHDPTHYYRVPGGLCNTTEHIRKFGSQYNLSEPKGRLEVHRLERGKCLWYTKTVCMEVSSSPEYGKEYRCICSTGRTWEDSACLAFHDQPCLWDYDCVRNADCETEGVEDNNGDDPDGLDDQDSAPRSIITGENLPPTDNDDDDGVQVGFRSSGICKCKPLLKCQYSSVWPPFIDESANFGLITLPFPYIIILTLFVNIFI